MTEYFHHLILGIIQGLTEFLPVSSSGHLEIAGVLLGENNLPKENMLRSVVLHVGTALSTIWVFRSEITDIIKGGISKKGKTERQYMLYIAISMLPAAFVGIKYNDKIEELFKGNLLFVGAMLILTACLLLLARFMSKKEKNLSLTTILIMGIAQSIAIIPGISRSGATVSTALISGTKREDAAQFSFLMVVPLILGKIFYDLLKGGLSLENVNYGALLIGFIAAFVSGLFACKWMINIVKKIKFTYFAYYCLIVGVGAIVYSFFNS